MVKAGSLSLPFPILALHIPSFPSGTRFRNFL